MEQSTRIDCRKCFMPFDDKFINEQGNCVICHEHSKKWLNRDYGQAEAELVEIFAHYKKRNHDKKYDCIVAFSGGKDSVYALYLAKEKYGLRPLAVTADNGLLTQRALQNMETIVDRLDVDHLVISQDQEELQSLYRAYFKKTKNFCEICYLMISWSLGQAALTYDVPLLITGFAFKIDSSHFRAERRYCFEDSFVNIVKDVIPEEVYSKYLTKNIRAKSHFHLLHLFDYVNHVEADIYRILEDELGWDSNNKDDKHSDCRFHHMLGYLRWLNGDLTSLVLMAPAALLRDGQITRHQFEEMSSKQKEQLHKVDRNQMEEFLDYFDIDESFLEENTAKPVLAEPLISAEDFAPLIEAKATNSKSKGQLLEMLIDIVRPEIRRDSGDIHILDFSCNLLKIKLSGGCRACMIADQVMIRYLEYLVRKYVADDIVIENTKEWVI